jgi:hypothetical protein
MAERSIAAVLKTVEGQTSGGSNPSLSAFAHRSFSAGGLLHWWASADEVRQNERKRPSPTEALAQVGFYIGGLRRTKSARMSERDIRPPKL